MRLITALLAATMLAGPALAQSAPTDKNTGWDLNDNKPVDLPDQTPAGQPNGSAPGSSSGQQPR